MARYLGEEGENCPITAAAIIEPPLDMKIMHDAIASALFGIYDKFIFKHLKLKYEKYIPYL